MILLDFVVIVKLFSQVFRNLGRSRNLQVANVEHCHFFMVIDNRLVAFDFDDAIHFVSDGPELALLWCFLFHA